MVEAHELGHLFYAVFVERAAPGSTDHQNRSDIAERFCWDFALETMCPRSVRRAWCLSEADGLLRQEERRQICELAPSLRRLTYFHIRAIAVRYKISMRLVITALDRHPLLNEAQAGIVVFRRMANPATGRDTDLRVWLRARPSWGFVILRQRAAKQGFVHAAEVYERGADQRTISADEQLLLRMHCPDGAVRWPEEILSVPCAYTSVDVNTEGRYVLATWPWPNPEA